MNIFELSAFASPLAEAIAGGVAVKAPGLTWLMLGIAAGLGIGIALYFAAIGLSSLLGRLCMGQKLSPVQWVASLTAVLLPAASPFAAWAVSIFLVSVVLHL
jgi:hypothetical protein